MKLAQHQQRIPLRRKGFNNYLNMNQPWEVNTLIGLAILFVYIYIEPIRPIRTTNTTF